MKRLFALLLALLMVLSLVACGSKQETPAAETTTSGTTRLVLGTSTTGST